MKGEAKRTLPSHVMQFVWQAILIAIPNVDSLLSATPDVEVQTGPRRRRLCRFKKTIQSVWACESQDLQRAESCGICIILRIIVVNFQDAMNQVERNLFGDFIDSRESKHLGSTHTKVNRITRLVKSK